jgi:hypothetical protein
MGESPKGERPTVARREPQLKAVPHELSGGTKLGDRYLVIDRLGQGGFGSVYRAKDLLLDRDVALKVLEPEGGAREGAELLSSEAKALARVQHPGVVAVHDAQDIDGRLCLSMELASGRPAATLVEDEGPVATRRALRLTESVAEALDAAHAHGVVHGDVKPSNVLVEDDSCTRLVDFGLARLRRSGAVLDRGPTGSPGYTAPEVWEGAEPSIRSDVYSLAATTYELLTGHAPFEGDTGEEALQKTLEERPRPAHELRRSVPRGLSRVLDRGLSQEPEKRFASCGELARELRRAARRPWLVAAAVLLPLLAWAAVVGLTPDLAVNARLMGERYEASTGAFMPIELGPDSWLAAGDAFWIEGLSVTRSAKVQVFMLDPSGRLERMHPSGGDAAGARVEPGGSLRVPAELVWRLDRAMGTETLFIVADRNHEPGPVDVLTRAALAAESVAPTQVAERMRGASADHARSLHALRETAVEDELRRTFEVVEVRRIDHR